MIKKHVKKRTVHFDFRWQLGPRLKNCGPCAGEMGPFDAAVSAMGVSAMKY